MMEQNGYAAAINDGPFQPKGFLRQLLTISFEIALKD
jgi:hypothetical protein